MKKPKMIIFDFGQTLVAEDNFDGLKGIATVMSYAVENKYNRTPEQVFEESNVINNELMRFDPVVRAKNTVELPNYMFTNYLYESQGIKLDLTSDEIDRIYWDAAAPGKPSIGMQEFLDYLWEKDIRTAVLSNITYSGKVVEGRINRLFPDNHFEFIIPTSEYLFRKPNPRIFKFALDKAGLVPEEVWYVGDNYTNDIVGANNVGITPIWYLGASDYEQQDHDDVIKITSWEELKNLLN